LISYLSIDQSITLFDERIEKCPNLMDKAARSMAQNVRHINLLSLQSFDTYPMRIIDPTDSLDVSHASFVERFIS
jgi:hypothetical protein